MKNYKKAKKHIPLIPGYIIVTAWCMFTFVLVGWIIAASFSTTRDIFSGEIFQFNSGISFVNYKNALFSHNVANYFMNSVIYTTISGVGAILIACPAAYVLSRFVFKGRALILNMFITALSIPSIMVVMPLYSLAIQLGITNSKSLLTTLYVCMLIPFTVFFMCNFFRDLPESLEEAASIDGASPMYAFWRIMFPLAQPGIITVGIFNFLSIWNEYFMSIVFAGDADNKPVAAGLQAIVQSMTYIGDWAGLFAAVVIVFMPTFIIYVLLSEKIIAGVTGGAVKG